jgi:Protein of unknown function (DUF2750)
VSQAASQAATFYREVVERQRVWTLRDERGFPAPQTPHGRAQPFWSSRSRVERIIENVQAYRDFEPVEIGLNEFVERWLPGLERDGLRAGVNWSGNRAIGYDLEPAVLRKAIDAAKSYAG